MIEAQSERVRAAEAFLAIRLELARWSRCPGHATSPNIFLRLHGPLVNRLPNVRSHTKGHQEEDETNGE